MVKQSVNWDYRWGQIVGRAWADQDFNLRLRTDPAGVLTEYDLTPPAGVRVEILDDAACAPADSEGVLHLVLPGKPSAEQLSEDDLTSATSPIAVARCGCGGCHGCGGCGGCGGCVVTCVWCYYQSTDVVEN
jgi:hypothetical protein